MRYALIVLLLIFESLSLSAQTNKSKIAPTRKKTAYSSIHKKHYEEAPIRPYHIYADVSTPLASAFPGFSVTYSYKTAKHWGLGIGINGYDGYPTGTFEKRFATAIYGDGRLYIRPLKRNQFFSFFDLGLDFYNGEGRFYSRDGKYIGEPLSNHGIYCGLGLGYSHRITKRGGELYTSLQMIANFFRYHEYNVVAGKWSTEAGGYGTIAWSFGYKF